MLSLLVTRLPQDAFLLNTDVKSGSLGYANQYSDYPFTALVNKAFPHAELLLSECFFFVFHSSGSNNTLQS